MTNKINSLLAMFMALFMFSCAAEQPAMDITPPPPMGDKDAYNDFFNGQRDNIDTGGTSWTGAATPGVDDLAGKFLVTRLGRAGSYISLYIKPLGTGAVNADINYASANSVDLAVKNSKNNNYFDPRKLVTSEGGIRMAWSGRVADPPSDPAAGVTVPFTRYTGYDNYSSAAGSEGGYSIKGTWNVHGYDAGNTPKFTSLNKTISTYVKSGTGASTRAWFWSLPMPGGSKVKDFAFVSESRVLGFGSGNAGEPQHVEGSGWKRPLSTGGIKTPNASPPGKMLFGRNTRTGVPNYEGNTAVFLTTVVGYNIRTKSITGQPLTDLGLPTGATAEEFYMEFDADSYKDASADGYESQFNFPHWNSLESPDAGDSITLDNKKVQKFTGILLKLN